jgi:hypothetical protein
MTWLLLCGKTISQGKQVGLKLYPEISFFQVSHCKNILVLSTGVTERQLVKQPHFSMER